jgi:hypothetical protein
MLSKPIIESMAVFFTETGYSEYPTGSVVNDD